MWIFLADKCDDDLDKLNATKINEYFHEYKEKTFI